MERHTLSVLLENKPGALTRVTALFARRAFNIHSVAVGPTLDPEISRITIVADADQTALEQITKQLNKLINVVKVVELEDDTSVQRELLLVKVGADDSSRPSILQICDVFRGHVVDVVPDGLTIEVTGSQSKIKAFIIALTPYGIKEIVQSGSVAISRGSRAMSERITLERNATYNR